MLCNDQCRLQNRRHFCGVFADQWTKYYRVPGEWHVNSVNSVPIRETCLGSLQKPMDAQTGCWTPWWGNDKLPSPPTPQLIFGRENRENRSVSVFVGVSVLTFSVKRGVRPRKTSLRALCVFRPVGNLRMGRGPIGLYYNNKQNRINYIWHYNHEHMTVTFIR